MYVDIEASDDSLGIFQFPSHLDKITLLEGTRFNLSIQRTSGALGAVHLYWRIVNASSEFEVTSSVVTFDKDVFEVPVELRLWDDKVSFFIIRNSFNNIKSI